MQIQIKARKGLKVRDEETAFVSFPYDKFLIDIIRGFVHHKWHAPTKQWEVEIRDIPTLISVVKNQSITITCENKRYMFDPEIERDFEGEITDYHVTTPLFDHQKEAVDFGMHHKCMLLADEPGLGKTLSFLSLALVLREKYGYEHTLIVCGINSIKWNWVAEIHKHTKETPYILGQRRKRNGRLRVDGLKERIEDLNKLPSNYFIITNLESIRNPVVSKTISKLCLDKVINIVAVDESQFCVNPTAQQSLGMLQLAAENKVSMTGTPIMNKPLDLWVTLSWMGVEKHNFYEFKSFYENKNEYSESIGYKNLNLLSNDLSKVMIRRLKKDVLNLPERIFTAMYVEMADDQAQLYEQILEQIKGMADKIRLSANPLVEMLRLRQATGCPSLISSEAVSCAKVEFLDGFLEERISAGRKCILVSNWSEVTNFLRIKYNKYNPAYITGEVEDELKMPIQDTFNNDPSCMLLIGTIKSMGVSFTLNAADTLIFYDEPWNYSVFIQCADRNHRIGQDKNVQVVSLLTKYTIDERIHEIIEDKKELSDIIVDHKKKHNLFDFLIS